MIIKFSKRKGCFPSCLENCFSLVGAFAVFAFIFALVATFRWATCSEATSRIVLCYQTGLLVSHLFCCLHNIPHESMLSRRLLHTMPRGFRHSVFCVCKLIRQIYIWYQPLPSKESCQILYGYKKAQGESRSSSCLHE